MNKQNIKFIQEQLSVLINQPLRTVSRGGGSIFISFGDLIEKNAMYRDEDGNLTKDENGDLAKRKILIGKYSLHIECSSRFVCGDKVVIAKYELYQPTSEQAKNEDFDWDSFDWDIVGNNRYDELLSKYFDADSPEFVVEKITVNKFGDLIISFTNDFVLDVFVESSEHECWRFFEYDADEHLVVSGQGIEEG